MTHCQVCLPVGGACLNPVHYVNANYEGKNCEETTTCFLESYIRKHQRTALGRLKKRTESFRRTGFLSVTGLFLKDIRFSPDAQHDKIQSLFMHISIQSIS